MNSDTLQSVINCVQFMHNYSVLSSNISTEDLNEKCLSENTDIEKGNCTNNFKTIYFTLSTEENSCTENSAAVSESPENGATIIIACDTENCIHCVQEECSVENSHRENGYSEGRYCDESSQKENCTEIMDENSKNEQLFDQKLDVVATRKYVPAQLNLENDELSQEEYLDDPDNDGLSEVTLSDIDSPENQSSPTTRSGAVKFICDVCSKIFRKKSNLKRHYRIHTGDNPHACEYCPARFPTLSRLNEHKHVHSRKRPFVCKICNKSFARMFNLTRHYHTHEGKKAFQCDVCLTRFSEATRLRDHYLTHTGDKKFACDVCDKKFLKKYNLNRHYQVHAGKLPHKCKACGRCFGKRIDLLLHRLAHAKKKEMTFQKAVEQRHLKQRCLTEQDSPESGEEGTDSPTDPISNLPGYSSDPQTDTSDELEDTSSVTFFTCDKCDRQFLNESNLVAHVQQHANPEEFQCSVCHAAFDHASRLKEHFVTHSGVKPYSCEVCERRFGRNSNLLRHLQTHSPAKQHQCDMCQRQYDQIKGLEEHYLNHHGTEPHQCNVSRKHFHTPVRLQSRSITCAYEPHLGKKSNLTNRLNKDTELQEDLMNDLLPIKPRQQPRLKQLIQTLEARLEEPKIMFESNTLPVPQIKPNPPREVNSEAEPSRLTQLIQTLESRLEEPKVVFESNPLPVPQIKTSPPRDVNSGDEPPRLARLIQALEARLNKPKIVSESRTKRKFTETNVYSELSPQKCVASSLVTNPDIINSMRSYSTIPEVSVENRSWRLEVGDLNKSSPYLETSLHYEERNLYVKAKP